MISDLKDQYDEIGANNTSSDDYVLLGQNSKGFLCPVCMVTFSNPVDLQAHFSTVHSALDKSVNIKNESSIGNEQNQSAAMPEIGAQFICPHCFANLNDDVSLKKHYFELHQLLKVGNDTVNLQLQIDDLKATIQDEKWYSSELKKELDHLEKIQRKTVADFSAIGGDEFSYQIQQIQMLEAGKIMATQRMLELEKECGILKRTNESNQREKDNLLKKCASTAKEMVQLKSQLDEENQQKQSVEEELLILRRTIEHLDKKLGQRPSEDDVSVLRRELVHAQTLMDTITLEKEGQITLLNSHVDQLAVKNDRNEKSIELLTNQLSSTVKTDELTKLDASNNETVMKLESDLNEKNDQNARLSEEISSLKCQINEVKNECQKFEIDVRKMNIILEEKSAKINELESENSSKSTEIEEIQQHSDFISRELEKYRGDFVEKSKEIDQLKIDLFERDKNVKDLRRKIIQFQVDRKEKGKEEEMRYKMDSLENITSKMGQERLSQLESKEKEFINTEEKLKKTIGKLEVVQKKTDEMETKLIETENIRCEFEKNAQKTDVYLENAAEKNSLMENQLEKLREQILIEKETWEISEKNFRENEEKYSELLNEKEHIIKINDDKSAKMEMENENLRIKLDYSERKFLDIQEDLNKIIISDEKHKFDVEKFQVDICSIEEKLVEITSVSNNLAQEKIDLENQLKSASLTTEKQNVLIMELENNLTNNTKEQENEINSINARFSQVESDFVQKFNNQKMENANLKETIENLEIKLNEINDQLFNSDSCLQARQSKEMVQQEKRDFISKIHKAEENSQQTRDEMNQYIKAAKILNEDYLIQIEILQKEVKNAKESHEKYLLENGQKSSHIIEEISKKLAIFEYNQTVNHREIEDLNIENEKLQNKNDDFSSQMTSWQEEKRLLMQHCLKLDSDLDFEKERALENKRRFEEVLEAMHELGRANQSMQVDRCRYFERKWLDDSDSVVCTACQKLFSLLIRKHHCRNCGLIFCTECSSKTARIASFKHPVRVCDKCLIELDNNQ